MTIVFVLDHYNSKSDGTCITAQRYEDELVRLGHTVRIVSCNVTGENKFALKERHVPIVSAVAKKQNIVFAKYNEQVLIQAFAGADAVHIFMPLKLGRKALNLARQMGIPATVAFHVHPDNITKNSGMRLPKFVSKFIFWYWEKVFYSKARHIHCPSQFTANELKKHNYKANLHVISNGITKSFYPMENKPCFSLDANRKFEILMVGSLACEKRQDILIEAVRQSKYKNIINITFAGRGPQLKKLKKMAEQLPNKPKFLFFTQQELLSKIHSSDLYVHAADVEIEGMSCMEAFAAGLTPVIGNAEKSATKQFAIDERCSFEAGNPTDLKKKIEYWIEHPAELAEMSEAYVNYSKQFSLENSIVAFEKMIEQEIKDNAVGRPYREFYLSAQIKVRGGIQNENQQIEII